MKAKCLKSITILIILVLALGACQPAAPTQAPATQPPATQPPVVQEPTAAPPVVSEQKVLKVAELQPLSGEGAGYGGPAKVGYTFAVEDINAAGGIKVGNEYYRLEIVEYDTKFDPSVAATVARQAIYEDGVKYMVLHGGGPEADAILPIVEENNVVLFALTDDPGFIGPKHPSAFYIFFYVPDSAAIQYEYLSKTYPDATRVVGTFPDTASGQTLAALWTKVVPEFGFEIVDTIFVPPDTSDFYPMLTPILGQDVDIIEQAGFPGGTTGKMIAQARELGWEGRFVEFTGGEFEDNATAAGGWDVLEGLIGTGYPAVPVTAFGEEFYKRCEVVMEDPPVWLGYFYDQMWLLKAAIEKAGSIETADVLPALEEVTFSGVLGENLHFAGKEVVGINRLLAHLLVVSQVVDGSPVPVYTNYPLWAR